MESMTLSETTNKWFKQHGLEGFVRKVEATTHDEAEKVVMEFDTEVITKEAIRALTRDTDKVLWGILPGQQGVPNSRR